MKNIRHFRGAALLGGALLVAGCGDFLEVTNPGPVLDSELNDAAAVIGLVTGMSGDLAVAMDNMAYATSIMADELAHGGSYTAEGLWYRGVILPEDVNAYWGFMQRARWVAEHGLERMKGIEDYTYETDVLSVRANLYAGFANRLSGENVCQAVIDGGPAQVNTVHFERAEGYFAEALRLARAQNRADLANAALGGLATALAWQGKWAEAADSAAKVPTPFRYDAIFSNNSGREQNYLVVESNNSCTGCRRELTVYNTPWAQRDSLDPRAPWKIIVNKGKVVVGQDGKTPFYQQMKYPALDSNIPLTKGTEMRLLQAEAALRGPGGIPVAMTFINDQRAYHGLPPLPDPATLDEAWDLLTVERGAVVWLEARRLWDMRRWYGEGRIGEWKGENHDKCVPISQNEQNSNPNLQG